MVTKISARAPICPEIHSRKAANLSPAHWAVIAVIFAPLTLFLKTQLFGDAGLPLEV